MAGAEIEYFTITESQMDERGVYGNVRMNPLEVLIHIIHTRILMSSLFLDAGTGSTLAYTALYELLVRTDKDVLQNLITIFYRHYTLEDQVRRPQIRNAAPPNYSFEALFTKVDCSVLVKCFFKNTAVLQALEKKEDYIATLTKMDKACQLILLINITKYCPETIQATLIKMAAFLCLSLTGDISPLHEKLSSLQSNLVKYYYNQQTKMVNLISIKEKSLDFTADCLKQLSIDSADDNFQEVLMMIKGLEQDIWSLGDGANLIDDDKHTYIEMPKIKSAHQLGM